MKKLKPSTRNIVVLLSAILLAGIIFWVYQHRFTPNYSSAEFKSYKKGRLYCDQFFGGTHETDAELYRDMQQSHGLIGC